MAILGGGMGALSAAFELTAPRLAGHYDVTVYLPGWRLGGKCASGRGGPHQRIEEHGLHVWFGIYANAFDLIQRCYAEWAPPPDCPLCTWRDAFEPCNDIVLFEQWNGVCKPWPVYLAPDGRVPGSRDDGSPWELLRRVLELLLDHWSVVRDRNGAAVPPAARESGRALRLPVVDRVLSTFGDRFEELHRNAASHLLELAFKVAQVCSLDPSGFGLGSMTLQAGEDFDEAVLGIPVAALPSLCEDLAAANRRFKDMLEHADTVVTQAIQLWLVHPAAERGWPLAAGIATGLANGAGTCSSMAQLLGREDWGRAGAPADVIYLSGVVGHDGLHSQADADARVRENALAFLEHDAAPLWPAGAGGGGEPNWDELAADAGMRGAARLDAQFLRANFQPAERYVLTPAGSVAHRLGADQSGFENLKLAGDWTRNGIDVGSVEAAVTSGMQAARAISGHPRTIQGEHGWLVD